ncbi:hypothetical protein GGTG_10954 [Gaeumannomyces tritici R3-111a-1]|uniref:Uncharacterized protein n=1 Tax=Gaeumannomyces tritici (strain R3-111a-1) TaxID=644352 RepID=J3PBT3_GAET3|nr:hypothetical protein GGTG_10954 [Gaeumannomyces tritici R3-111a-1]EJT71700.1 hypothetical protein GGTG_10954 [Gaeumannomyces tritici R3-111a-1]
MSAIDAAQVGRTSWTSRKFDVELVGSANVNTELCDVCLGKAACTSVVVEVPDGRAQATGPSWI